MTQIVTIPLALMLSHWVADFLCQTDWMAQNKSKSWRALLLHTFTYSTVMSILFTGYTTLAGFEFSLMLFFQFWFITFISHTATDYVTSRWTSKLWQQQKVHWFFVVIGFDQLMHYTQLLLTFKWLYL
ncbi:MAG: DUF3307 domain-containing protein [Acinetobacter sp.]|uniref:DUF3307 domain-containing protein n=1 Tax=Acinetobacter sp. TaxID=472 RepID=UPI000F9CB5BF|nr:DUF3307 domain-containing protein [Acinetobacter sp.]RUP42182.1 MAG: DUF3307 domain-containing protein [Acinetobacter sp.]